jgi:AcrR family transcriptional regulator
MVMTPWGEAEDLRSQMLRPTRGASREKVDRSQRERLMAAAVALASERGYDAMNVSDLVVLSGVSRGAFYRHFKDKRACFLAAMRECMERLTDGVMRSVERDGVPLMAVLEAVLAQPAAARICLGEAHAAGPQATALLDRTAAKFEDVAAIALENQHGEPIPRPICRGIIGGLRAVVETRLRRGSELELQGLADELLRWSVAYPPPTKPLRRRRAGGRRIPLDGLAGENRHHSADPGARIVEAATQVIAKEGFSATTIKGVAEAAHVSLATLYRNFAGKDEILDAVLDAGMSNLVGRVGPVVRRARNWVQGIQLGSEALLAFLASEPDFARVISVEVHAAGAQRLERRQDWIDRILPYLSPPKEPAAKPPVAAEAIGGAVVTLIENHIRSKGPESLEELAPAVIYMAVAPSVDVKRATAAASGRNSD